MKTLIKNITVLTIDKKMRILENANVVVENDTIIEISFSRFNDVSFDKVIDGTNKLLMPGFINTHTHVAMTLFRGLGDDMKDRLTKLLIPLENSCLNNELVYQSSRLSLAEMLLSGTTCFADMYPYTNATAKAAKELGIRAFIGQHISNSVSGNQLSSNHGFDLFEKFMKKYQGDPLINGAIAPHSVYMADENTLVKCKVLSDKYNVPLLLHLSEMEFENKPYLETDGSVVKYLNRINFLGENLICAHGILVDNEDIKILGDKHVSIAHCPAGNSKSGRKIAPIYEYRKENVNVSLATDGPMSGNHMDMITVMNYTPKMQKVKYLDRSICEAKEIVKMATIAGAMALNIDDQVGSIEVGKKADFIIINPNTVNMLPLHDYYAAIVYGMQVTNIQDVFVNGVHVVENSKLQNSNEEIIIEEFQKAYKQIKVESEKLLSKAVKS